jgi:endoglucanase
MCLGVPQVMVIYCFSLIFYLYVRVAKTLDLGRFLAYGIFVLVVECMGATTTLLYGVNILLHPVHEDMLEDPAHPGLPKVRFTRSFPALLHTQKESHVSSPS